MKKAITTFLVLALLWVGGKPHIITASNNVLANNNNIVNESLFINIIRDLELLDSWLIYMGYPQETIDTLRAQNYPKILALHKVDQQSFEDSTQYYLSHSVERALQVYEKLYAVLEVLVPLPSL